MVRNRYLRIQNGRWLTEHGQSKNRCGACGELKRGHVCKVERRAVEQPMAADDSDTADTLSNSSSMLDAGTLTPTRHEGLRDVGDYEMDDDDEGEGETSVPTEAPPSVSHLVCAPSVVACEPLPPTPPPHPLVSQAKQLNKLERQGSLEVLAVAASLVNEPVSG